MTNDKYVFDAEQLELSGLGKLDKDQITWITIKGNHIPIPKGGSRQQKAEAIKTWFANKKKELPQKKPQGSVYSAKFEHERPEKGKTHTGEGAEVHTHGQYTQKRIDINKARYFDKFKRERWIAPDNMMYNNISPVHYQDYLAHKRIKAENIDLQQIAYSFEESGYQSLSSYKEDLSRTIRYIPELIKDYTNQEEIRNQLERKEMFEKQLEILESVENKEDLLKKAGYVKVSANYLIKNKPVFSPSVRNLIQLYQVKRLSLEDLKNGGSYYKLNKADKELLATIEKPEDIVPAKAQMSKILIPAEKYFLDEDKKLTKQPSYIKKRLAPIILKEAIDYQYRWDPQSREKFYEDKETYEKLLNLVDNALHNKNIESEKERESLLDEFASLPLAFDPNTHFLDDEIFGANLMEVKTKEGRQIKGGFSAKQELYSTAKTSREDRIFKVYKTALYDIARYNGKELYDNVSYRSTPTQANKAFLNAGIVGSTYWGGTDKRGHVLFNPEKDIKVVEKTTDPSVIQKWIEEQEKHSQKQRAA